MSESYQNNYRQMKVPWKKGLYSYDSLCDVEKTVYDHVMNKDVFLKSDIVEIANEHKLDEFQVRSAIILLVMKKMIPQPI